MAIVRHRVLACVWLAAGLCLVACEAEDPPAPDVGPDAGPTDVVQVVDVADDVDAAADLPPVEDVAVDVPSPDVAEVIPDITPEVVDDADGEAPPVDVVAPEVEEDTSTTESAFSAACATDDDCDVACGQGTCAEGLCTFTSATAGCVVVDAESQAGWCMSPWEAHPAHPCVFCNPAVSATEMTSSFLKVDFELGAAAGFDIDAQPGSSAQWSVVQTRASSGVSSLYFGDPDGQTYGVGGHVWGRIFTPSIAVPEGASPVVSFQLWLDTEETQDYDYLRVLVYADGEPPVEAWHSNAIGGTTGGLWLPHQVSLEGFGGQTVTVAFEFDTVDALINGYEGAYIDDVRVTSGCCATDGDCATGDACMPSTCGSLGGACEVAPVEGCCNTAPDCDDGNPCTVDGCDGLGASCVHEAIEGCCQADTDCDDGDPCTATTCVGAGAAEATCESVSLCCSSAAECDDGDTCTEDSCVDSTCKHINTCCLSDSMCNDGDYCTKDTCLDGKCNYSLANFPGCCENNADCDDGDICTQDHCDGSNGSCISTPIDGCCKSDLGCDDGMGFTFDSCVNNYCMNCGDNVCSVAETCSSCESDCGSCCPPGEIPDCLDGCIWESWIGDGWCDTVLNCVETGWDGGDCS